MDIWHLAVHEFGHALCLIDLYSGSQNDRSMYGYVAECDLFARSLHVDDIAGIRAIYGACGDTGACCDSQTCSGTMLEADCAHDWYEGQDCTFFRCPQADCNEEGFESGDLSAFPWVHPDDDAR